MQCQQLAFHKVWVTVTNSMRLEINSLAADGMAAASGVGCVGIRLFEEFETVRC